MKPLLLVIPFVAILFAGCEQKPKFTPPPPPTPPLGPPAQRGGGAERLSTDEAMTFADLSLLLRTSTAEDEIMRQIAQRGFIDPLTVSQAQSLATIGGSARLIVVVQDPQYVLTPSERQEFTARKTRRDNSMRGQATADRKQRDAEFEERQKQLALQQQTFNLAAQKEREQKQREQAKIAYEQRKKSLEQQIESLQRSINEYRRTGMQENSLTGMNQQLKNLQDELFHLKSP